MADRRVGLAIQSGAMTSEICHGSVHHFLKVAMQLPDYLAKTNYREPKDPSKNAYVDLPHNPKGLPFFEFCKENLEYQASFTGWMSLYTEWKENWTDIYDTKKLFEGEINSEVPILVDVGGNTGVDMLRFLEKHPEVPRGSLVLQDQAHVIDLVKPKVDPRVEAIGYDFFTPQPIIGSRAYLYKLIIHDWPDNEAMQILQNLRPAMKKGYSKLLICEVVLPAKGASLEQAMQDVLMMACIASFDRTEAAWRALLAQTGYKVVQLWEDKRGLNTVIEAELAD
ncbi:O-demethylpuromycin-O-methyltransferase [Dactylellina cionopaga]|nr:O-demethylpuromycin-O-methyltransferase [Dactylellina cionopaga]